MCRKVRYIFLLLLISAVSAPLLAQQKADQLFQQQQYAEAFREYAALISRSPKNQLYQYRYARCAYELDSTNLAIEHFMLAGEKYPLKYFYLGNLYFNAYRFTDAKDAYETYADEIDEDNPRFQEVEKQIELCKKGERYIKRVDDIVVLDSVCLPKKDFLKAYHLSEEMGMIEQSAEGTMFTTQRGDRRWLTVRDSLQKQKIMSCYKMISEFNDCDTLPEPVASDANDAYPFLLSDGVTIYFASDREEGLGGYDIYMTKYNSETDTYLAVENLGMPFNSFANDYMLVIDETAGVGYFATDRRSPQDSVTVYQFVPNKEKRIIKGMSDNYVARAAQLKAFRAKDETEEVVEIVPKTSKTDRKQTEQTFRFIVKDNLIYTSLKDFKSIEAKLMFQDYLDRDAEMKEEEQMLEEYRKKYFEADEAEKRSLAPVIRTMELTNRQFGQERKEMLNKIRIAEMRVLNSNL